MHLLHVNDELDFLVRFYVTVFLYPSREMVLSGLHNSEAAHILRLLDKLDAAVLKHWHNEAVWNTVLAITADGR